MIREAIDRILGLASPTLLEIGGRQYGNQKLYPVREPQAEALVVHTLTGIVDYLNGPGAQDLIPGTFFLQVVSHEEVSIRSTLIPLWKERECFMGAIPPQRQEFPFGKWLELETFIIELQAKFVPDDTTKALLALVASIKDEAVRVSADDGFSQSVTARAGIALVSEVKVPNPVTLRPYRTFMEVEQPACTFVFRLRSGGKESPFLSLHEADGGAWRLKAIQSIKEYLNNALPEVPVIA